MTFTCDILPLDRNGEFGASTECRMPVGHLGPHHSTTTHRGDIVWAYDDECGCCAPDEPDRCFWWTRAPTNQP